MKTTYRIAKAELQVLFYSPVAWLILVIFALQTGIVYTNLYGAMAHRDIVGQATKNITYGPFSITNWMVSFSASRVISIYIFHY